MRGLDLHVFDFDYDLTWCALMIAPDGTVLGRFGGRDAETPGKYHSLKGLRFALEQALARHRKAAPRPLKMPPAAEYAEELPAAARVQGCIHCHHVYEFRRDVRRRAGTWQTDDVWVYPEPENVGLTLDLDRGNRVVGVRADSPAAKIGVRPGDVLESVNNLRVASVADVQYALHRSPAAGNVAIAWERGGVVHQGRLTLSAGWRKTDVSWRHSLQSLSPNPGVYGDDLTADEKRALGLRPEALAFRHGAFLLPPARHAGVRVNDVIVGVDDRPLDLTARQFETYIRLNYRPGDTVTLNVLRGTQSLRLPLKLAD
jgi:membrane-associated protease RseP (regulator of RpoE activity)